MPASDSGPMRYKLTELREPKSRFIIVIGVSFSLEIGIRISPRCRAVTSTVANLSDTNDALHSNLVELEFHE